jgi:hypothetical protein
MIIMTRTYDLIELADSQIGEVPEGLPDDHDAQRLMDSALDFQEQLFAAVHQSGSKQDETPAHRRYPSDIAPPLPATRLQLQTDQSWPVPYTPASW